MIKNQINFKLPFPKKQNRQDDGETEPSKEDVANYGNSHSSLNTRIETYKLTTTIGSVILIHLKCKK